MRVATGCHERWRVAAALLVCALLAGCEPGTNAGHGGTASSEAGMLWAGAASTTVSPAPGDFIAGDARNRRFTGVHDPLYARALYLSDGATALALVVVDNIGLTNPDIERMRRRAADLVGDPGLPPQRVIVSSTHTHSGPDVVGLWGEHELSSGRDPAYVDALVDAVAAQVAAAAAARRPVTARVASGDHDLAWVQNVTEPGLLDRRVTVLQFRAEDGATVATLTNFACHPTVLDAVFDQVSSDYVAGFYQRMEERLGGEHLFLQGAIGGWVQPDKTGRGVALAERYGAAVAETALALMGSARAVAAPAIRFASKRFEIPLENAGFTALLDAGVLERPLRDGHLETEAAWFAVGEVEFVTHPGETSPAHSLASRALLGAEHSMVLGLTLDALGYILKPEYFDAGAAFPSADYLTATSVGPEAAPRLMATLEALARQR
ncbi:MAG: hypothetical protein RIE03_05055 [Pseudomonadales bacterium]